MTPEAAVTPVEPSWAEVKSMMQNGGQPKAETPVAEAPKPETAVEAEVKTEPEAEPVAVQEKEQPRAEDGKFVSEKPETVKPDGVQKRIDKAVKAQREAERQRDEAIAKLAPQESRPAKETAQPAAKATAPPKLEDFASYDDYQDARTEWKAGEIVEERLKTERQKSEKTTAEQRNAQLQSEWSEGEKAARTAHPDYDAVIADIDWPKTPAMSAVSEYIIEAKSPGLLYMLQKNPDEIDRISKLPPIRAIAEMGKLEARLVDAVKVPAVPVAEKKVLPKPPATVSGTGAPKDLTLAEAAEVKGPEGMRQFKKVYAAMQKAKAG